MKIVIFLALIALANCDFDFLALGGECCAKLNVSEDVFLQFLTDQPPTKAEQKCLVTCIMQRGELMSDEGVIDRKKVHAAFPDLKKKYLKKCISQEKPANEEEICYAGYYAFTCMQKYM